MRNFIIIVLAILLLALSGWHTSTVSVFAQTGVAVQPFTYPDITGTGATVQLSSALACQSLQILAPAANAAVVRWGDSSTSVSRGGPIAAGGGQFLPPNGLNYYPLSSLYVYVASGDKAQFVCFR